MTCKFSFGMFSFGVCSSALALAVATFSGAVSAAPVPPSAQTPTQPAAAVLSTRTVTYLLQNHNQHVTLTSSTGKTLLARQSATPTLQLVLSFLPTVTAEAEAAHVPYKPQQVSLVLEDQNGLRLWSQTLPFTPQENNFNFSGEEDEAAKGTRLTLLFSVKKRDATPSDTYAPPPTSVVSIGPDGQVLAMKTADQQFIATRNGGDRKGATLTTIDGSGQTETVSIDKDGKGVMLLNGAQIPIDSVERNGKHYMSFVWNGHKVFIGNNCTFHIDGGSGDLTVDPPSATK